MEFPSYTPTGIVIGTVLFVAMFLAIAIGALWGPRLLRRPEWRRLGGPRRRLFRRRFRRR